MAAANTDKFQKVGVAGTLTSLSAPGHSVSGTTITVGSTTNWPTDTAVTFAIRQVDSSGVLVAGTYTEWRGVVSGSTLTSMVLVYGTDQVYPAGSTTQVYIPVSAHAHNRMVDALLTEHDQDGTHGAVTASSVTATTGTFTNLTVSGTATSQGWTPLGDVPDTVTANGNRNYDIVFNGVDHTSTLSPGMKLQLTRTVAAPDQCADLEASSSQYFSKTSPTGLSFTTTFTCSAWVKLESYTVGGIIARRNADTEGWSFGVTGEGRLSLTACRIASNNKSIFSYASIPLNKWVHVAATMDVAAADTTAQKFWIDGVEVARSYVLTGTATALVQGTTALVVGAEKSAGTNPFDGKLAQVAVFSTQLSDATVKAMMNQGLSGSESGLVSAFSLDNSLNDLSANANNLTAQGSATATDTDSPFANAVSAGLLEYAEVNSVAFSTNTTVNVRVPDTCQIPTSGGVSAVSYSTQSNPYGLPYFSRILGYAEVRADFTDMTVTTSVTVSGLTIPVIIPTGAKVRLTTFAQRLVTSGATNIGADLRESTTVLASTDTSAGSNVNQAGYVEAILSPTPGSHTYNTAIHQSGAGTMRYGATSTQPAFIKVELV